MVNLCLVFQYNRLINDMLAVYNSASICAFDEPLKCGLRLDPGMIINNYFRHVSENSYKWHLLFVDLNVIMSRSRDWNELQHTWIEWRRRTGQKVRDMFEQLVDVSNQGALLNSKFLLSSYTNEKFTIFVFLIIVVV